MRQIYRRWLICILLTSMMAGTIVGCADNNSEPAGKHDNADMKGKRQDKKGD